MLRSTLRHRPRLVVELDAGRRYRRSPIVAMTVTQHPSDAELEDLLTGIDRDPVELVEALRSAREARAAGAVAADLDATELSFLSRCAADRRLAGQLAAPVATARIEALRAALREQLARPADDAIADCASIRAVIDERLRFEAVERYAELATEEEDLSLSSKVALLDETARVYRGLAERTGDRELRRLARRTENAACDRRLQQRIERVLTPSGAVVLEGSSLLLLLVVLAAITLEWVHGPARWIEVLDASICSFFVLEFVFRLALAPARGSWFLRNFLTDLLPAIPAAAWFFDLRGGDPTIFARVLRFLRVVYVARYLRALRPLFAVLRLILFLVRGLDALVRRFSPLLNRNFVFFERVVLPLDTGDRGGPTAALHRALRREHVLLAELPPQVAAPLLEDRAQALAARCRARTAAPSERRERELARDWAQREIPVEHAIAFLWRLQPSELPTWLLRRDIAALDRMVRVLNAPVVRSLPLVRRLRSPRRMPTAEERIVDFGRRVALQLEAWRERVLHFADMHGIVTGPQVLDRVATAIVRVSQRPAVRLLLFGALFTIVRLVLGADSALGAFLARFVATPLVVLGAACLVLFALGRWLKSLAGEAADVFKLTSEAQFIGLVDLVKRRREDEDLEFLARRVFASELEPWEGAGALAAQLRTARGGRGDALPSLGSPERDAEVYRVAMLYLHFLDGAPLHEHDLKATEQLLANLSLQNIRNARLGWSKREHRRLRKLSLHEPGLFRGPYVWFRFVTESVAVEVAKLVTDYNRHCLTIGQRANASADECRAFAAWMRQRRAPADQRRPRGEQPGEVGVFRTTEFNALDFLTVDPQRVAQLRRVFGKAIPRLVALDRRRMIREIFGTRPLHRLPRSQRSFNVHRFYVTRLSHGRVFLLPLWALWAFFAASRAGLQKLSRIVAEILSPVGAARSRELGRAPFAVALRKIQRMKGPTVVEAIRLRVSFDPRYAGAPESWSDDESVTAPAEIERDMEFLGLRERDRDPLRATAERHRRRVEELHVALRRRAFSVEVADPAARRRAERAVTIAYMTDRDDVRTLLRADEWFERLLQQVEAVETVLPAAFVRRALGAVLRGFGRHPVDRWIARRHPGRRISRRGRGNLKRLWQAGDRKLRRTIRATRDLPQPVRLADEGFARLRRAANERDDLSRELAALRAVQSLSVLDVGNYRALVFELGAYADDGEDPAAARRTP